MTRTWRSAAQLLFGVAALVLLTWLCYTLRLGPTATAFAYLIVVVLLSLTGSFVPVVLSFVALGFFNYFFTAPLFDLRVDEPLEAVAFLITSLVVIGLVRRGRRLAVAALESRDSMEDALREAKQAEARMREQAGLLDLTHDAIFVRDMDSRITYWNRGAEELYGWSSAEAVGKVTHQLLQTVFPEPLEAIVENVIRLGRWEGELVHTRRDGMRVVMASRWALRRDEQGRPVSVLETNNDVTGRRQADEALRRQANLLDQTHDAILVWPLGGAISYWNSGAERLYGYTRGEAIGRTSHDLLRTEHSMPAGRFVTLIERDGTWTGELAHWTRDGRRIVVDSRHVLFGERDGSKLVLETNRDISDRKRAEEALRDSEEQWRAVFENNPTMYFVVDAAGTILSVNPFGAEQLGYRAGELVGRPVLDVFLEADRGAAQRNVGRCLEHRGRSMTWQLRKVRKDGTVIWVRETARAVLLKDRPVVLVACEDITESKRLEAALGEAQAQLAHVTRVTTLGEVTASLAHEVNQPLAAIVNNANACLGVLPEGRDLDEVREALDDIVSDGERASAIIERVRGLARRSPAEKAPVRLAELVDDVVVLAAAESTARGVAITTDVGPDLPLVPGDRVQLQQVLLNLVVNGMDAMAGMAEGDRRLEIRARPDRRDGSPGVLLSVQDRGIGLESGQMEKIFEAFYTTKPQGMGMGLAISRSIIEGHGGRLWAENNPGPGATFVFRLPATAASEP